MGVEAAVDALLGSAPVRVLSLAVSSRRLRVFAYHGIAHPDVFDEQLRFLTEHLTPVALGDVVAALDGVRPLPARAAWVTFDDGDPSVVDVALPLLRRHGVRATMFVCPGVIEAQVPHWWDAVPPPDVAALKSVPDADRRASVGALTPGSARQLDRAALLAFAEHGDVGNHTWDHPMLDRCDPDEQRRQVRSAHDWLVGVLGAPPLAFAYPNGNVAPAAAEEVATLGYRVALLHDHRLADIDRPLAMSRLRSSDTQSAARFAGVAVGAHPLQQAVRRRVRPH